MFRHREARERDACACARDFIHLPEHESRLREYSRFLHLFVKVVPLSSSLADTGEHRVALVNGRDISNKLLQEDSFTNTSTAEESYLSALDERTNEVDDFDAGFENGDFGGLLRK